MSGIEIVRTADVIAVEINIIKDNTLKTINDSCVEIGRRLVEAKTMVPHGEWGTWLQNNVSYSKSTANNLMRIYEEYGSNNKVLGDLNYTQAVALLGLPSEEREKFVEEHNINEMSTRDIQAAIKEKEAEWRTKVEGLQKKLDNAKNTAVEKCEEAKKLLEEKERAEADARLSDQMFRDTQKDVKMLQDELQKVREEAQSEITRLQLSMMDTKEMIAEAQAVGDPEEVKKLQESLDESKRKIAELEKELKDKPIETTASTVVEKIPDEVEQELSELRKLKSNESTMKFKFTFDNLVKDFQSLLEVLAEIPAEEQERYRKAVSGLINKMGERL